MKNLTGMRFGKLTVIEPTNERKNGQIVWKCKCDCGKEIHTYTGLLTSGRVKSCGCLNSPDLTGQRFGRLLVVRKTDQKRGTSFLWECQCDCGNTTYVGTDSLNRGHTRSCGCLQREKSREKKYNAKHRDLTGMQFGLLTALRPTNERRWRTVVWECQCECGKVIFVPSTSLTSGNTRSCGCIRSKQKDGDDTTK